MTARLVGRLACVALAAAALAGCSSDETTAIEEEYVPPAAASPPVRESARPAAPAAPRPDPARRCLAGATVFHTGRNASTAVLLRRPTTALTAPGGAVLARFDTHNVNDAPTVFRVLAARLGPDCAPRWYRVQLPIRPNGATGWIRATGLRTYRVETRIHVDLSERRIEVLRGAEVVARVRAAIGRPSTPTPTGDYYVNQRLLVSDPSGPWGPGGIGISAFSPVLVHWEQGGPIAIHGTNQPGSIGDDASYGCLRVDNDDLLRLMDLAPPGTPVRIVD